MTQPQMKAARYDTAATLRLVSNPVWIIVMGMAWSLGMAASVMVVARAFTNGFAGLQ